MLSRMVTKVAAPVSRRWLSTSVEVDWEGLRRKITSDSGREELARQRVSFEDRRAATSRVADAPEIDWDFYASQLPEYNMAEIKSQFENFMSALPDIEYDPTADLAEQAAKEDRASRLQTLSTIRYDELLGRQREADDFALHDYTGAHEMYLRHPGLFEKIQQEVDDREFYVDLDPADKPVELSEEQANNIEWELLDKAGLDKADFKRN